MVSVMLVHGYVKHQVEGTLNDIFGVYHIEVYYVEGGGILSVVTDEPVSYHQAVSFADSVMEYDMRDDEVVSVLAVPKDANGVLQNVPLPLADEDDNEFLYLGVLNGYSEDMETAWV